MTRLVVSLVLTSVDYCNSVLTGVPLSQLNRLQAVINDAARLILSGRRRHHITPLFVQLHWLRDGVAERTVYNLCVLQSLATQYGFGIPGQQLPTRVRRHDSETFTFGGKFPTDCTLHPLFNTQRPGVPCRRCTRLERSSTLSVICTVTSYF